ncbi:MAG: Actin-like protein arp9 (SWI/SNF complex component arp9) [Thelocarpon impressellum]|nr:MAG: Actin-like protein arp9 (SWI/SNF complex component arp9) [Thelocarpon impressellum]
MPPFKDEHILVIAPGSQTTLAQLGLPESFTPARLRLPTRMFPAQEKGQWEPVKIRERKSRPRVVAAPHGESASAATGNNGTARDGRPDGDGQSKANGDVAMAEADGAGEETKGKAKTEGDAGDGSHPDPKKEDPVRAGDGGASHSKAEEEHAEDDEDDYDTECEEDLLTDEGAVYPLTEGRVTDWPCFLALLNHIHNTLSPPFHTPILLIAQPSWTEQDHETVTQFFFEKFKTPAFCLIDSALAVCYAYGVPTATVVDVGYDKADVTAVSDFLAHQVGRGVALSGCGGEAMTQRLLELLEPKGWTRDMCEQLKKSHICEILGKDVPLPGTAETERAQVTNPAAAASTGALGSGAGQRQNAAAQGEAPRGPGPDTEVGDDDQEMGELNGIEREDGVLDVAAIVTSGKTQEYLARKEKEKAERAAFRKAAADAASAPARPVRLPNAKRERNTFFYEERRNEQDGFVNENGKRSAEADGSVDESDAKRQKTPEPAEIEAAVPAEAASDPPAPDAAAPGALEQQQPVGEAEAGATRRKEDKAQRREEKRKNREAAAADPDYLRREIEVGVERFMAASGGYMEKVADAVYRSILAVPEVGKRGELWESLVIVGNGSKVRGFRDGLINTLTSKYLISPSSATIFTSELPSNLSTPMATGANTPQPQAPSAMLGGGGSSVNPLLLAATTASQNPAPMPATPSASGMPTNSAQASSHAHSSHGQTPTSVKTIKIPDYFSEWKDVGFEEAVFLGAQVAAKVVFVVDQGLSKGFMTRVEYNEVGPIGIHETML